MSEAKELATGFMAAEKILEEYFAPFVERWLAVQVSLGKLTQAEAAENFKFDPEETRWANGPFAFTSFPHEEYIYGAYEICSGGTVYIYQEFLDDPEKFEREAKEKEAEKIRKEDASRRSRLKTYVEIKERELLRAKVALEKDEMKGLERGTT